MGGKGGKLKEDRISLLPNEVVGAILSLLTFREATRTCVLSHRWERLWNLYNGSLIFDFKAAPYTGARENRQHERSKYIDWVNQVLASIDGGNHLNEFILGCFSDEVSKSHIDRWVTFAFKRRVQKLKLDMLSTNCLYTDGHVPYSFPVEFCAQIKEPSDRVYTVSGLTSLCLTRVHLNGALIEHFLSNCPLLEHLCVHASDQLINLKVIGASPTFRLKYLEIRYCFKMESLEVSAPNLVSFNYIGPKIVLQVENNPKLLEVAIGRADVINLLLSFSSYFTQIESLTVDFYIRDHMEFTAQCLKFTRLRHLTLKVVVFCDESLLGWTTLIRSCPLLHKFTLEIITTQPGHRNLQEVLVQPHENLKEVEVVGFGGNSSDTELLMYLVASSTTLEKIIVNCCYPCWVGDTWKLDEESVAKHAARRRRAERLKKKLPPNIELVLI